MRDKLSRWAAKTDGFLPKTPLYKEMLPRIKIFQRF
jgi:hypothetical protein